MPAFKTHILGGALFYAAVIFLTGMHHKSPAQLLIFFFICSVLGALFPDVDTKSKGQKIFFITIFFIMLGCLLYKPLSFVIALGGISLFPLLVRHRGIFHNIWFLLIVIAGTGYGLSLSFPALRESIYWGAFFFSIGVISHLWLDLGFKRMLKLR